MTEDNKYYTPQIEDFHIGFKYEYQCTTSDYNNNWSFTSDNEWKEAIFEAATGSDFDPPEIQDIQNTISGDEHKKVRVKKLSKECIEEAGWKLYDENDGLGVLSFKKEEGYTAESGMLYLNFVVGAEKCTIYTSRAPGLEDRKFVGTIRNKSELKKIMKMVNIK